MGHINLVKICVGADGPEDLLDWQRRGARRSAGGEPMHVTRMWPRRAGELLAGGSLYWVFRGQILARQRLVALEPVTGQDGTRRCGLVLHPDLVRTRAQPRKAFQGWRYLDPSDAPGDLPRGAGGDDLPPALSAALAEIGVR